MGKLTLTFLGVGSAFAKRNAQSNALVEAWVDGPEGQSAPDDTVLIDFGMTGPTALHALKQRPEFAYLDDAGRINYPAISNIIVTHQHADHVGGLEELAAMNMHVFGRTSANGTPRPRLISTQPLLDDLWTHSLSGGLSALSGRTAALEDYFTLHPLRAIDDDTAVPFTVLDRFDFALVRTDHLHIRERFDWPSYGVRIVDRLSGASVFYSGDTRFDHPMIDQYVAPARLSFHDAQLIDEPDPVHALLSELRTLPESVRRKMYLYHYGDTWDAPRYEAVQREFAGFAVAAHRYPLFD